jgi:hypothetical protein
MLTSVTHPFGLTRAQEEYPMSDVAHTEIQRLRRLHERAELELSLLQTRTGPPTRSARSWL